MGWNRIFSLRRLACAVAVALPLASAAEDVRVVTISQPDTLAYAFAERWLGLICQTAKLTCTLEYVPSDRAVYGMRSGQFDAEFGRGQDFPSGHPDAGYLLVNVPYFEISWRAVVRVDDKPPARWEEFKGSPLRVGVQRGILTLERRLREYPPSVPLFEFTDLTQCLDMMSRRRLDVCMIYYPGALPAVPAAIKGDWRIGPSLESHLIYPFVTGHKPELVNLLGEASAKLAKQGENRRLLDEVLAPYADILPGH